MGNIFIGLLLICLDFDLTLENIKVGLLPNFLGYIVMIKGLKIMAQESPVFIKAKPFAAGMAVYTGILYIMDLLGISASYGALTYLLSLLATGVLLYILYIIVSGVSDTEKKYEISLEGDRLKSAWILRAVFDIISYVLYWFWPLPIIGVIGSLLSSIYFLVIFHKSKHLYYAKVL